MDPIKITIPRKLTGKGVTHFLFNIWRDELESILAKDSHMAVFLPNGVYSTWESYAKNPDRIKKAAGDDKKGHLAARRYQLRAFLNIVADACDSSHNRDIILNSTSLQWIYNRLQEEYNIQENKMHFLNLFNLCCPPEISALDFYNHYRKLVIASLKKKGDTIKWQTSKVLKANEALSPTFEEMILAFALSLIDPRLPGLVKDNYNFIIGEKESVMDHKMDILNKVPILLTKTEEDLLVEVNCDIDQLAR